MPPFGDTLKNTHTHKTSDDPIFQLFYIRDRRSRPVDPLFLRNFQKKRNMIQYLNNSKGWLEKKTLVFFFEPPSFLDFSKNQPIRQKAQKKPWPFDPNIVDLSIFRCDLKQTGLRQRRKTSRCPATWAVIGKLNADFKSGLMSKHSSGLTRARRGVFLFEPPPISLTLERTQNNEKGTSGFFFI